MSDSNKSVGIGVRVPEAIKNELENAAWAEGTSLTQLVLEGIALVLGPIREKYKDKGGIPVKPKHESITWIAPTTETPKQR